MGSRELKQIHTNVFAIETGIIVPNVRNDIEYNSKNVHKRVACEIDTQILVYKVSLIVRLFWIEIYLSFKETIECSKL